MSRYQITREEGQLSDTTNSAQLYIFISIDNMGKNNRQRRAKKQRNKALRKKELSKKRLKNANQPISPVFQLMPNPLSNLNDDERKQVFQEIAQNSEKAFQESLSKIRDITKHYDPITLLAILSRAATQNTPPVAT